MEEEASESGRVLTSENGRWGLWCPKEWQGRPLVEATSIGAHCLLIEWPLVYCTVFILLNVNHTVMSETGRQLTAAAA